MTIRLFDVDVLIALWPGHEVPFGCAGLVRAQRLAGMGDLQYVMTDEQRQEAERNLRVALDMFGLGESIMRQVLARNTVMFPASGSGQTLLSLS